jgi:hypothetical protein
LSEAKAKLEIVSETKTEVSRQSAPSRNNDIKVVTGISDLPKSRDNSKKRVSTNEAWIVNHSLHPESKPEKFDENSSYLFNVDPVYITDGVSVYPCPKGLGGSHENGDKKRSRAGSKESAGSRSKKLELGQSVEKNTTGKSKPVVDVKNEVGALAEKEVIGNNTVVVDLAEQNRLEKLIRIEERKRLREEKRIAAEGKNKKFGQNALETVRENQKGTQQPNIVKAEAGRRPEQGLKEKPPVGPNSDKKSKIPAPPGNNRLNRKVNSREDSRAHSSEASQTAERRPSMDFTPNRLAIKDKTNSIPTESPAPTEQRASPDSDKNSRAHK